MEKHIHKYVRIKIGENKRIEMKCSIPGCVHHIAPELAIGRESICTSCGDVFILTQYNIRKHTNPKCIRCKNTSKFKQLKQLEEILEKENVQS